MLYTNYSTESLYEKNEAQRPSNGPITQLTRGVMTGTQVCPAGAEAHRECSQPCSASQACHSHPKRWPTPANRGASGVIARSQLMYEITYLKFS